MTITKTPTGFSWDGVNYRNVYAASMCKGCAFNQETRQVCELLDPAHTQPNGDLPLDEVQRVFGGIICVDSGEIYQRVEAPVAVQGKTIWDAVRDACRLSSK